MNESGISLIEIIVSILMFSVILISGNKILVYTLNGNRVIEREIDEVKNKLKINHLLFKVVKDVEAHPFSFLPRVQKEGSFKLTDGSPHNYENRVNQDSDLITYGNFIFNDLLKIEEKNDGLENILACEVFKKGRYTKSKYKSLVGISNNYFYELKINNINKISTRPDCYRFSLKVDKSLLFKSNHLNYAIHINYLLPIKALYTIFLDKNLTIRFLSSIQSEVRENQPLKNDFFKLKFEINKFGIVLKNFNLNIHFGFVKDLSLNTILNLSEFKNEK